MTPGEHTGRRPDDDTVDGLEAIERAWKASPADEPPADVDINVLRQARAAVATPSRRAWPWTRRWTRQLATVAVAAVAVTLVLQLRQTTAPAAPPVMAPAPMGASDNDQHVRSEAFDASPARAQADLMEAAPAASPAPAPEVRELRKVMPAPEEEDAGLRARQSSSFADEPGPEAWLARIEALKDEGDPDWRDELARFRAAWPDYPVPQTLLEDDG
ncbi:hypothetical protein F3N42_02570 [Marinihelvus fidelis]|uniref:Uncharacterized protein n=1 Tax=Marinihelvus fidelis TaxID=2613842 RepID=A0A5N0THE4_9GAMM|nr:hypothetical protein [Marinihelvus fidelis]KAA9133256.1 hypothetical protein F3N42_02570 [Marinihelvus fidelis]